MTPESTDLSVECPRPSCRAGIGEPCLKPDGRPAAGPHKARTEAIARDLEERQAHAEEDTPERIKEPRWRRLYAACRLELEARGDWTTLAREQLEVMVRNMSTADACRELAGNNPVVRGSTKQAVANPLFAIQVRLDAEALRVAKALKLTPDSRGASAPGAADLGDGTGDDADRDPLDELDELAIRRKANAVLGL